MTVTDPEPRDIATIAREAVATQEAAQPSATISSDIPEELVGLCTPHLETAITELIENGVVHNHSEDPQVEVTVGTNEEWVELRIADNGPGIPPMEYESLDSESLSQLSHDTGFGLNLAYWIIRRAGGHIHVRENDPTGTLVVLHLPRPEHTG